jgi:predicted ATPase
MRYKRFVINNYRAISGPLVIDVDKSLTPIIGVNESGKTTILHAIFAFDHHNDRLNGGRHRKDTSNLYRTSSPPATIEAVIEMTRPDLNEAISDCERDDESLKPHLSALKRRRGLPSTVTIRRDLTLRRYSWDSDRFGPPAVQHALAEAVVSGLPYILFFDDFRDKVDEKIEITSQSKGLVGGWLSIIDQLFRQTDREFSVFKLPSLEERQRKTVLAKVQRRLNETLTREWQSFRLDDRDALKISIDFDQEVQEPLAAPGGQLTPAAIPPKSPATTPVHREASPPRLVRNFIKLDVVETDSKGDEHFFFISDRSKGFYWFFNFVMKLEFNPKFVEVSERTIYLLDEPGSYLHAFAQRKLCQKLRRLSDKNCVIYCTHSHYLLDPETIPVTRIVIADKDGNGNVSLIPITNYRLSVSQKRSALEPVIDALQIRPFALDLINTRATVIAEGIYDYFAIELFRNDRSISVLPSVGADSIKYYVSLLIAWQVDFRALWDNDDEGRAKYEQAVQLFGSKTAEHSLRLLPAGSQGKRRIMQDLFDGSDLVKIRRELALSPDCSFDRTLHAVFYSPRRAELVQAMSQKTKANFEELFQSLSLR